MNDIWAYYDVYSRSFYNPRKSGRDVFGFALPRLDWVRLRLATTLGRAKIDATTGIPTSTYRYSITDYTSSLFALKSLTHYLQDADGSLAFTNGGGFDTSDTGWHGAASCCVTFAPIVVPLTVDSDKYQIDLVLLKTNQRWTLRPETNEALAPWCYVQRDVYTGTESNAPAGLPGGLRGTWTISGTSDYVDLAIPSATSNTQLAIGVLPSTNAGDPGTITQTPLGGGANTVRLSVQSSPGTGGAFNGNYTLLSL